MSSIKLKGADYLLLLLYFNNKGPIFGAVRLEKMMFLFNNEIAPTLKKNGLDSEKLASFYAYNYGPFSKDILEQIDFFKGIGFIKIVNLNSSDEIQEVDDWEESEFVDELWNDDTGVSIPDSKYMKYEITELGARFVIDKLLNKLSKEQQEYLSEFKKKITGTSINKILHYVYVNYPDYTKNSLIKDTVLNEK